MTCFILWENASVVNGDYDPVRPKYVHILAWKNNKREGRLEKMFYYKKQNQWGGKCLNG